MSETAAELAPEIEPGPTFAARLKMSGWLGAMEAQLTSPDPMPSPVAALHDRVADLADEMFDALDAAGEDVPEPFVDHLGQILARIEHAYATLIEESA